MSEPYTGEIRMFGGNFAPLKWAFCNGTLLTIASQAALYSLIGTAYGGDGRSSFALPDLRGRIPVHQGQGPGLTPRIIGQKAGAEEVVLTVTQIPSHTHNVQVSADDATLITAADNVAAKQYIYEDAAGARTAGLMHDSTIGSTGEGQAHNNMMPFLCISFIICLEGVYPQRN
ncbi:microcystin-dependent protein [Thioflavicoccus mobilis 8321]|uniref:Microcystin-dependent protein n=1 Tax=Thioflavicoccus mobilis 8321 TaxID=765912 RepID=L0H1X1_9GAMM|nr:tail fiber protein [Thioflavicoccus mobilis]AGA92241.1 microcystin-dependent protein [Thioflavicoccus mobilis 8321]